ncbi:MAG: hypothetical protein F6J94_31855 [Moorea sp. SIO1F2]|nr:MULTISPECIES: hypothetical protein [unclassified Moorena]NEO01689.1 hypothetical protein [Moorena sp. SIO3I7]NEO07127.1 hypothetical protein [Moorena sp. SIO3I8]NEQ57726.1 hypothetical protein [Moorena sp. SIO4A1]NET86297.1 hypothetical protein [Moorena sp. SIO1F2]
MSTIFRKPQIELLLSIPQSYQRSAVSAQWSALSAQPSAVSRQPWPLATLREQPWPLATTDC